MRLGQSGCRLIHARTHTNTAALASRPTVISAGLNGRAPSTKTGLVEKAKTPISASQTPLRRLAAGRRHPDRLGRSGYQGARFGTASFRLGQVSLSSSPRMPFGTMAGLEVKNIARIIVRTISSESTRKSVLRQSELRRFFRLRVILHCSSRLTWVSLVHLSLRNAAHIWAAQTNYIPREGWMSIDREPESLRPQDPSIPILTTTQWTDAWLRIPLALPPVTTHTSGYRIERQLLEQVEIFGRPYRLSAPFDCRLLFDPAGRLWMSNTPQEHIMMYNNAAHSWGHVLVGGLGLGLYPQYALAGVAGQATGFTIIERSPIVRELVEPVLRAALDVPLEVRTAGIEEYLASSTGERFDTIFLDTWDTLDAARLARH